jgi:hypothetical protein
VTALRPRCIAAAVIALTVGQQAWAVEGQPRGQFDKGTRTFQAYGGYFNDLGPYDVEGGFGSAGFSYYFVDGMSVGVEVSGYGISQPVHNAAAGSIGLAFRHHLIDTGNSTVFVDVTGSAFEATHDVPDEGTQFNFFTTLGLGMTQHLDGNSNLMFGVRYFHLSNANLFGDDVNPALNGVSFYVGLMIKL